MLGTLNDGHVNIISPFDVSRSEEIFLQTYGRRNIDPNVVMLNYLGPHYHSAGGFAYNTLRGDSVVYIRYSSFSNSAATATLNIILKRYPDAAGVIFDIRQNGGGSVENIWNILALMPAMHTHLYTTQIKAGPDHDDFSEAEKVYSPFSNGDYEPYRKPVIVLTDRGSYSASSFFALCAKGYDNMLLMGDTTGGGLGLPNGGELPNGWTYRFPVTRTIAPDGQNYENGVPPDTVVLLTPTATAAGKDNVIETAADVITADR
jgi:C-terminal processing protease CtpA/Prc